VFFIVIGYRRSVQYAGSIYARPATTALWYGIKTKYGGATGNRLYNNKSIENRHEYTKLISKR